MNKRDWLKTNAPTILTVIGCVGTVVTGGLAIRAGLKIADICAETEEDEKPCKKKIIKACIPAAAACVVSIGCNAGADILNRGQKSDLLAMCAVIGSSYSGYRQEVIKRYGAEVDKEITDTVAGCAEYMYMAPEVPDKLCHWVIDMCMDDLPKYEIDAYERDILHAEMHLNRNYILCGEQSFRDLLIFLGVDVVPFGNEEIFGWAINDSEIYYLDFVHTKIDENTFRLTPVFAPCYQFDHLDMWGNEY